MPFRWLFSRTPLQRLVTVMLILVACHRPSTGSSGHPREALVQEPPAPSPILPILQRARRTLSVPLGPPPFVTVPFWHAMDGSRGQVLADLVKEFNLTHPTIVVRERFVGSGRRYANHYNVLIRELLLALRKGEPPVLAQVYENWTTQFLDARALVPMEELFAGPDGLSSEEVEDFIPLFRQTGMYEGKIWTLPFNKSLYVLYYNQSRFKRLALSPPRTWEEFREVASRLMVREKNAVTRHGFVFQPNVDIFGVIFFSHGGEYFNGTEPLFNGPVGAATLQYLTDLVGRGIALPSYQPVEDFLQGKADMLIATTPVYLTLSKAPQGRSFRIGMAPLPRGTEERHLFAGTNLALFARATPEQQRAAWLFVKWLLSRDRTAEWAARTGYLPVRTSAFTHPDYLRFLLRHPEFRRAVRALDKAKGDPRLGGWESIRWIISEAVEHAVTQAAPPQGALDEAVAKVRLLFSTLVPPPRPPPVP